MYNNLLESTGWMYQATTGLWLDPFDNSFHTGSDAIRIQVLRQGTGPSEHKEPKETLLGDPTKPKETLRERASKLIKGKG